LSFDQPGQRLGSPFRCRARWTRGEKQYYIRQLYSRGLRIDLATQMDLAALERCYGKYAIARIQDDPVGWILED
jgi:hypothetical protein